MRLTPLKLTLLLIIAVGAAAFLIFKFSANTAADRLPLQNFRTSVFSWSEQFKTWALAVPKLHRLAEENEKLKKQNSELVHALADSEALTKENELLRQTLRLAKEHGRSAIPAGIFEFSLTPTGYHALINRGSDHGITSGDTVVTSEGVLLGRVNQVFLGYSRLIFVTDPSLNISVKVLNRGTTGIAKGELRDGLRLDLILNEDQIYENDIVVTNGNDFFPAGLIVGTVRHVGQSETDLFKEVHLEPAAKETGLGSVIILKH